MKNTVFEGCGTAIITPFDADGEVNYGELGRIVDFQIENGANAIIACGTTGEASTMPDAEHMSVVRRVIEVANRRVPVIAGAGSNYTAHAVELSLEAQKLGADALLHVTPYYNKTSQQGLVAHFGAVADAVSIPVIIYNVPGRTGMTVAPETYAELAKHRNIAAAKEASGNFTAIPTAMNLCLGELDFYSGNDENVVPIISIGGKGVISVLSNVKPRETADMCRYALSGDFASAARLQLALMPLINALFSDVNPIPVKAAMNIIGFNAGPCRLPLGSLAESKLEMLRELLS
jgi:4-hydroxy-tetrahydrodipicolinate synthase